MKLKLVFFVVALLGITSCTSGSLSQKGTGNYPNSIYTASGSQDIQSAVFGAPNSKVQLKLFSDYQCPACIVFHDQVEEKLWKDYIDTGKVTATFYNFPLTFTGRDGKPVHPNAEGDALGALCALSGGKYREYRNALYTLEDQKQGAAVTDDERVAKAKEIGLDVTEFTSCLTGARYQKALEREIDEGNQLGLEGTPSVYLNNKIMNFRGPDEFFKILDAATQAK
ncbi:MAG: thioredoxin domain-containing protein [Candidatus Gracilibacteria bacterium]|nr:thioredoxin domain-containing protein [Candidatus Gracilibacteria bacterium]